jgi:hypothetical protein
MPYWPWVVCCIALRISPFWSGVSSFSRGSYERKGKRTRPRLSLLWTIPWKWRCSLFPSVSYMVWFLRAHISRHKRDQWQFVESPSVDRRGATFL